MAVTGIKVKGEVMVGSIGIFEKWKLYENKSSPGEVHADDQKKPYFCLLKLNARLTLDRSVVILRGLGSTSK